MFISFKVNKTNIIPLSKLTFKINIQLITIMEGLFLLDNKTLKYLVLLVYDNKTKIPDTSSRTS